MNQPGQELNPNALAIVPAKRKRGRPRKHPGADDPNFHLGGSKFRAPPGFRGLNGNPTHQETMAGQMVSGVIEAEFDGGYLLTVKVHNSNITLRGVVFKPGRCAPVTAENDVAPDVQMVPRHEVPLRVSKFRSRGRNRVSQPPPSSSLVALKSKLASPPPSARSIVPLRGNVIPVVLQPVASSNQHGSGGTHELQPVALQVVHPRIDTEATPQPLGQENGHRDRAKKASPEADLKPIILPCMSKGAGNSTEDGALHTNHHQHMFMESFNSVQHYPINAIHSPLNSERTGKMTELLQAVQENAMKNQMPSVQ